MRAAVVDRYGPPEVVRVADVPSPVPGGGEVLVRVHAAAVTSGDARIRAARFPPGFALPARLAFGITRPRRAVLGSAFAGVVEALGPGATGATGATGTTGTTAASGALAVGDRVCGMTGTKLGAHAELLTVPVSRAVAIPASVSDDDAAGVLFGGTTARYFLHDRATVRPGQAVLVNGASGAVGTNAVQLAKLAGATVTAVTSAANAALVSELGADHVIDYTRTPLDGLTERFDLVFDTVGNLGVASGRRLLRDGGVVVLAVAGLTQMLRARGNVVAGSAPERAEDMRFLLDRVADGELTVVHDASFPLDRIADAHRRVDSGHKRGNVVVHPGAGT